MVDLPAQYKKIESEIREGFDEVFNQSAFINGQPVKAFSKELADFLDAKYAIPCGNGTDALQIALMALDPAPGTEVITTPFTFVATAEVIALLQLKPVFVDVEPGSFNLNIDQVQEVLTGHTSAIIPVHLFGQSAHMEPLLKMVKGTKTAIIEDNAQSVGAEYIFEDGTRQFTGTIGDIGTTSFYPTKNLGAYGDGGALTTNDDRLGNRIKLIANHGSDRKYYYDDIGVNSRLDTLQAVVLRAKLKRLKQYNEARSSAAGYYDQLLSNIDEVTVPHRVSYSTHVFHQYTILVERSRDALKNFLQENDIPSMVYYPVPLHISKAYAKYGYSRGDFPVSEALSNKVLSLPMHSELEREQQEYICEKISEFFKN